MINTNLESLINELRISFFVHPGFRFKTSYNVGNACFVDLFDDDIIYIY